MANGAAFEHAVELARDHPTLDVGVHVVLVGGPSLSHPGSALPATVAELVRAVAMRRIRPGEEMRAQIERILQAGLSPTHLDTHKHTHLLPPILDALVRIAVEFRVPWVRRPFDFPLRASAPPAAVRATNWGLSFLRNRFQRKLASAGCRTTDHFAGFQLTGRLRTAELTELIQNLPPGSTEFMCHPGRCGPELQAARTRLRASREQELAALTASEPRAALEQAGVELVNYHKL
jgi:predicted glycoside hydrolase/deacetylase ChbG (UPF0249 family)